MLQIKKTSVVRSQPSNKKFIKKIKLSIAAPSANISTKISPVSKKDVKDEFGKKISLILDGGQSKIGVESTIVT